MLESCVRFKVTHWQFKVHKQEMWRNISLYEIVILNAVRHSWLPLDLERSGSFIFNRCFTFEHFSNDNVLFWALIIY